MLYEVITEYRDHGWIGGIPQQPLADRILVFLPDAQIRLQVVRHLMQKHRLPRIVPVPWNPNDSYNFV